MSAYAMSGTDIAYGDDGVYLPTPSYAMFGTDIAYADDVSISLRDPTPWPNVCPKRLLCDVRY
eukprot:3941913-Rhodomonas_salina.2